MRSINSHLSEVDGLMGQNLFFIKSYWIKIFQKNGYNKKIIINTYSYLKNGRK
jgi:hypothetical protein